MGARMNNDFAMELKPGDKVIESGCGYGLHDMVGKVERLTKTQVILENGSRYRRKDGVLVGNNNYYRSRLRQYTEEAANKIRHRLLVDAVYNAASKDKLKKLSLEQLLKIRDILCSE